MTTATLNRVQVSKRSKARHVKCQFYVHSDPALAARFGQGETYRVKSLDAWFKVFDNLRGRSTWISTATERTEELLRAATVFAAAHRSIKQRFGDLLMLESPKPASLPALQSLFHKVVGQVPTYKMLPPDELADVLSAPVDESRDLFIGGSFDPATDTLTLTRGNLETLVVPVSLFRPSGKATADPSDLAVTDYGHTIRLGQYEASADAVLYEVAPKYRRRVNAKRRKEEKGFGASLRRLRIQKRMTRNDFPGIAAKTIARIERGETVKPHGKTLNVLAKTLGVTPKDVETY